MRHMLTTGKNSKQTKKNPKICFNMINSERFMIISNLEIAVLGIFLTLKY